MLRHLLAAAIVALSPARARAPVTGPIPNTGLPDNTDTYMWSAFPIYGNSRTPEESVRDGEIEMKYRETLRTRIPDKKPSNDPWKNIRAAPAAAAADRHRVQ
jgi:hypothetical protein